MTENGSNGMVMPVAPFYGGNGGGGNGGFGFGDGGWWLLILLIALGGNWGFGGGFGGGGAMGATIAGFDGIYPWMNQSNQIHDGFRDQMFNTTINGIQSSVTSGFGDVQNTLCNGFAGVNSNIANGFAQAEISENARQMANMNQAFALQSAMQNCCCETQKGIESLRYTVATENCEDRTQSMMNTRDIIDSQTRGVQTILDKLCALELDGYKRENDNLRSQLNMATLRESQTAQNAFIQAGLTNEVDALYNRLSNCPVPTVSVYGRQPVFTCQNNNNGCGCGCGM